MTMTIFKYKFFNSFLAIQTTNVYNNLLNYLSNLDYISLFLYLVGLVVLLASITVIYRQREIIINSSKKCLIHIINFFRNCYFLIIHDFLYSLYLITHIFYKYMSYFCLIYMAYIYLAVLGTTIFNLLYLIINNMDINTANIFLDNYSGIDSMYFILANVSISYLFADYLFMDSNVDPGSANTTTNVISSIGDPGGPSDDNPGPSNTGTTRTSFDDFVSSLEPGVVPRAHEIMEHLFGTRINDLLSEVLKLRAISVAEDNPWIHKDELTYTRQAFRDSFIDYYKFYMEQKYKVGISLLSDDSDAMLSLKKISILSVTMDKLDYAYDMNPPLTDKNADGRPLLLNDSYKSKLLRGILQQYYFEYKGSPINPTDQAIHDALRTSLNIESNPIPDRFTRDCRIKELNQTIFTVNADKPGLLTKKLTIMNSPILREVYSR